VTKVRTRTSTVYGASDMSRLLGVPCECADPVPEAVDDGIIAYYGGWNPQDLHEGPLGMACFAQGVEVYLRRAKVAARGYYRLHLPVDRTHNLTMKDQCDVMKEFDVTLEPAPLVVLIPVLMAGLLESSFQMTMNWCRCADSPYEGRRTIVAVRHGKIEIGAMKDHTLSEHIALAAAKKL
jgi:hypothetical protein